MNDLLTTVSRVYVRDILHDNHFYGWRSQTINDPTIKYIELPLIGDEFEVPCFAFNAFYKAVVDDYPNAPDAIVATLHISHNTSNYKTLEAVVRDLYLLGMRSTGLLKVQLKPEDPVYYISFGSIFDSELQPIALHSWVMQKVYNEDGTSFKYQFKYPLLRINPECFTLKENAIQRFISGKLTSTSLSLRLEVHPDYIRLINTGLFSVPNIMHTMFPKVLIEPCPYTLKIADHPSISTTNSQLLQVAIDRIDEVLQ